MSVNANFEIDSIDQLREIVGPISNRVDQKIVQRLDPLMCDFIRSSPLIFLSTVDHAGLVDISPKGDAAGFVHIDNQGNLLVPDRPGNKLVMGFENILSNNNVGLIFVVPNTRETLRVKGVASLNSDPTLLEQLSAKGKPAILCTKIEVQECFFHCGKAMIRSGAWQPETWQENRQSLMVGSIANQFKVDKKEVEAGLDEGYRDRLY